MEDVSKEDLSVMDRSSFYIIGKGCYQKNHAQAIRQVT